MLIHTVDVKSPDVAVDLPECTSRVTWAGRSSRAEGTRDALFREMTAHPSSEASAATEQ